MQKNKLWFILYTLYNNSKCIADLNVKWETIKLLEEGIRENLFDLRLSKEFSEMIQKHNPLKKKIDKLDLIEIKGFCSVKATVKRLRI